MSYALAALGSLAALSGGLLGLLYAARRWADQYRRAPATVDSRQPEHTPGDIPPLAVEPVEIDEWTTDLELWLRLHTTLNRIEDTLRIGLDDALHRFMDALGVDDAALLDRPGFGGVRELVGTP